MRRFDRTLNMPNGTIRLSETKGDGVPIVMLHGSGANRHVFEAQFASPLADRFRLIAMDLPGHGDSSNAELPETAYSLTGMSETIASVMRMLSIENAVIFGWSLGGHIAVQMLNDHPQLVGGLMLMGAPPVSHGLLGMLRGFHTNWDMLLASKEHFAERDVLRYAELCYGPTAPVELVEAIRRTDGRTRVAISRSMMRGDSADQRRVIDQAQIPVAIVSGEHDPFVRLNYLTALAEGHLWGGHVHILPDAGHAAFRDSPERFNVLMMRFAFDIERGLQTTSAGRRISA